MTNSLTNLGERASLRGYTADITDSAWLDRVWVRRNFDQDRDFDIDDVIDFFFDDTHYAKQPEDHLGESLLNEEEVAAVRRMVVALDTLLTACEGLGLTDAEYLQRPEWPAVHDAAKALNELVVANDAKMAGA